MLIHAVFNFNVVSIPCPGCCGIKNEKTVVIEPYSSNCGTKKENF